MNTPKKTPNGKKGGARNSQVSSMILAILDTLKKKPQNQGKDNIQILKEFLEYYRIDSDYGLLEEISKNGTVTFDMIKDDGFDIGQIIGDDRHTSAITLHNVLNSSSIGELGKDMEKVVIKKLFEMIKDKVPSNLKSSLDTEMNNTKTLNEFKNQLWNFVDYGDGGKKIDENLEKEIKDIRIENKDIVDGLVKDGKIGANDVDGNFKNWNTGVSKKFDKLITQEYLDGMKSSLAFLEKNFGLLKNTFNDFVPNMGWITKKYPWNQNEIDDEIRKKLDEAQESGNKEEFDELSFYAYIDMVQKKNKNLGDLLSKLFQNKFDFGKLSKEDQNEFLRENISARLEELKVNNVSNLIGVDQSDFEDFAKNIFDLNQNEIVIDTAQGDIRLGVNKKLKGGTNPNFVDMSNFADAKIPLEFDIKVLDQDNDLLKNTAIKQVFANEISEDGKNINLNGDNIGKIFLLYVLAQNSFDNRSMNKDNVDKLKEVFDDKIPAAKLDPRSAAGQAAGMTDDKDGEGESKESQDSKESSNKETGIGLETKEKTKKQEFLETRDNIKGYQFPGDKGEIFDGKEIGKGFEVGSRLWINTGLDTELPPQDVGGNIWIQLKIIDISNDRFVVELEGGEKKAGEFEGKKFTYYYNPKNNKQKKFDDIINAVNGDIYKLPEPKNWDKSFGAINDIGQDNLKGLSFLSEVELKGDKLQSRTIEGKPEITHFGSMETIFDEKNMEQKEIINYEVNLKNNGIIEVKLGNYKRKMDYNNFMIFVSTKNLKPKTKDEVEIDNEKKKTGIGKNPLGFRLNFFSFHNIIDVVKKFGKNFDEGLKKYGEKMDKKFFNTVVGDRRMANKFNAVFGWIPGIGQALENMDSEYQGNIDKETREKTEAILKVIEGHNDFGSIFDDKNYMNHLLGGQSLKDMILSGEVPGGLKKDNDKRFVASAILLAEISKGPGPYHKLENKRFKGIWVKLLLGEPYYSKFMNDQKEIIAEMKAKQGLYGPGYDAQLSAELARAEMTFLINNIGGRAPGQRLGNIGEGPTENNAKTMWSDKFAGELESRFNEYISKSKVEEGAGKLDNVHSFTFAYGEYKRFLESGRPTKSLPYLKKMAQLAKNPDQIKKFKGAIVYGMLTGFFLNYTSPSTQVWVQNICRSFGFAPGLWAPHIDHQRKLSHFLEIASDGKFYQETKYKLEDFSFGAEFNFKGFSPNFIPWWDKYGNNIDKFLNEKMYDKDINDPIINQLRESTLENQQEDIDQDVSKNSALIKNYPLLLTKGTINQISRYKDGYFEGKDVDEIQRSQDARNAIANAIPKSKIDSGHLIYITKRFLNRFDSSFDDKKHFTRIVSTIKNYKNKTNSGNYIQKEYVKTKNPAGNKIIKEKITGEISKDDVRNILVYAIKGKILEDKRGGTPPPEFKKAIDAFENMLRNNIDQIDENFISQVLGKDNLEYFGTDKSYVLAPWDFYQNLTEKFDGKLSDVEEVLKRDYKNKDDKYINIDMLRIKKILKRAGGLPSLMQEGKDKIGHPDLV